MRSQGTAETLTAFLISFIANLCYAVLVALFGFARAWVSTRNPLYRWRVDGTIVIFWALSNLAAYVYLYGNYRYVFLLSSTVLSSAVLFQEIYQFWRIGLVGADRETKKGIGYARALGLCTGSLDFLGLGAAKLTDHRKEFEEAIDRCDAQGRPIRFLLIHPAYQGLRRMARKAGVDDAAYQNRVRDSLRIIANLKNARAKNIQVRFYEGLPAFRLMFINDEICLASHYVLGKGDGSQLPQLHIIKRRPIQDIDSLYHGFKEYFEKIWTDSGVWNFKEFVDG